MANQDSLFSTFVLFFRRILLDLVIVPVRAGFSQMTDMPPHRPLITATFDSVRLRSSCNFD